MDQAIKDILELKLDIDIIEDYHVTPYEEIELFPQLSLVKSVLPEDYTICCICYELITVPRLTKCAHIWCFSCDDKLNKCPICNKKKGQRTVNLVMEKLMNEFITAKCICGYEGILLDAKKHLCKN